MNNMKKEKSILQLRKQKQIRNLVQSLFINGNFQYKDKRFFIGISDIDISPDLRNLKIFVEILDLELKTKNEVVKRLNKENVFAVKSLLAEKINIRYVPEILFVLDDSAEKVEKINKLIEKEKN
jgi:ribosome-binding factor A